MRNTLQHINGATWATGRIVRAVGFDGIDHGGAGNQEIRVNDAASLRPAQLTIAAWVKTNNPS